MNFTVKNKNIDMYRYSSIIRIKTPAIQADMSTLFDVDVFQYNKD